MSVIFGTQVCGSLAEGAGTQREWLVPDGRGGYATGTVSGLRTRRYHALLVVAGRAPAARKVGLVTLDPVLSTDSGATVRLGVHEWASGTVDPAGHRLLERFDLTDGLPRWRWRIGEVVLERELAMVYGQPSLAVVHRLVAAPGPVTLTLEALCTWRDAHGERRAGNGPLNTTAAVDGVVVEDAYRLAGPGWQAAGEWYRDAYAREEAARGLNPVEDLWFTGRFSARLQPGQAMEVSAWAGDLATRPAPATVVVDRARRRNRAVAAAGPHPTLALAADAFLIRAGETPESEAPEVVAGYPWFGAWSRDTMIAYEGLFLTTRRYDEGRALLRRYASTLSQGMLANTADTGQTEYNTVDATLWFLHAVDRHVTLTGDTDLGAELLPALESVVAAHVAGTRFGIGVDPDDGLLYQGVRGHALTWMDARVDGVPVTARIGKPVEVNALWVNGLAALAGLAEQTGGDASRLVALHETARASFAKRFRAGTAAFYDVVDGPSGHDPTLRPNQLLAYSLPYTLLVPDPRVLRAVGEALLTPLGLRTLAPGAPGYQGRHAGGPAERDRAYHQGTVWPWLIGPYADALVKAGEPVDRPPGGILGGIEAHLAEWGLGSVSETADGDPPHRATGCPFQAWSVAEVLRVCQKVG
jgi:predicted glycogen debranching enzyme